MKIIKKLEDMTLEQRYKLELFIKNYPKRFFSKENEAHSWGDFNRWPDHAHDRNHIIMSGEICIIDRIWEGRHCYVVCKFYAHGDKVKDLFPVVYVDDLRRSDWRNGYFLIPDLRDNKPLTGWTPEN